MEPEYRYIKGQGWVASAKCASATRHIGKYMVTFEDRKPELGERYFTGGNYLINASVVCEESYWRGVFGSDESVIESIIIAYSGRGSNATYTTISWVRIND